MVKENIYNNIYMYIIYIIISSRYNTLYIFYMYTLRWRGCFASEMTWRASPCLWVVRAAGGQAGHPEPCFLPCFSFLAVCVVCRTAFTAVRIRFPAPGNHWQQHPDSSGHETTPGLDASVQPPSGCLQRTLKELCLNSSGWALGISLCSRPRMFSGPVEITQSWQPDVHFMFFQNTNPEKGRDEEI